MEAEKGLGFRVHGSGFRGARGARFQRAGYHGGRKARWKRAPHMRRIAVAPERRRISKFGSCTPSSGPPSRAPLSAPRLSRRAFVDTSLTASTGVAGTGRGVCDVDETWPVLV